MAQPAIPKIHPGPLPGETKFLRWLTIALFFLFFFLYVWLRVEPVVEYYYPGTVFCLTGAFLKQFLTHPGGVAEYAGAFLAQLNHYNWLGASVFTVIGGLVFGAAWWLLRRINGVAFTAAPFVPPLLLLLLRNRYDSHVLEISTGLVMALGSATACASLPLTRAWLRLTVCWPLAALLGFAAGWWPCVSFLALVGCFEMLRQRRRLLGAVCLLPGLAAPLALIGLGHSPVDGLLRPWGASMPLWLVCALFAFLPIASIVLSLLPKHAVSAGAKVRPLRKGPRPVPVPRKFPAPSLEQVATLGLLLIGWTIVWFTFDQTRKARAQIEMYAVREEYDKLLAVAAPLKTLSPSSEIRLQLALYHNGRLLSDIFNFTNQAAWNLLPGLELGFDSSMAQIPTLIELGQVNEAEHLAQEAFELEGNRPDLLRWLVRINLAKDRPRAARIFLTLLRQVPFQRAWAERCLLNIEANPRLPGDNELALVRSRMVTTDLPHDNQLPTETFLRQLLHSNPRNQMAFEYLVVHYLITFELKSLAEQLGRLDDFNYVAIPRPWEEALLLYQKLQGVQPDLHGRKIRSETVERFQQFCAALNSASHQTAESRAALARDFGNTYWFHFYSRRPQAK